MGKLRKMSNNVG